MATSTRTEMSARFRRVRAALAGSARDEGHAPLWSGPEEIDRVESLAVAQRERLLRRGLVRRRHGEP